MNKKDAKALREIQKEVSEYGPKMNKHIDNILEYAKKSPGKRSKRLVNKFNDAKRIIIGLAVPVAVANCILRNNRKVYAQYKRLLRLVSSEIKKANAK